MQGERVRETAVLGADRVVPKSSISTTQDTNSSQQTGHTRNPSITGADRPVTSSATNPLSIFDAVTKPRLPTPPPQPPFPDSYAPLPVSSTDPSEQPNDGIHPVPSVQVNDQQIVLSPHPISQITSEVQSTVSADFQETKNNWITLNGLWRVISSESQALKISEPFIGGQITPAQDGVFALREGVTKSLHAHLLEIQEREWGNVVPPKKNSKVKKEKKQKKEWENRKVHVAKLIGKTIVADPLPGVRIASDEVSESFAYRLHHWMEACSRPIVALYGEKPTEAFEISHVLSIIGFTNMPLVSGEEIKHKNEELLHGIWNAYQLLHLGGENSVEIFIDQIIAAHKQGKLAAKRVPYAMDIFRKLPLFGKDTELMDAIELAVLAKIQKPHTYVQGYTVAPLDPASKEGKTIAFIERKVSRQTTSRRGIIPPPLLPPLLQADTLVFPPDDDDE